MLAALLVAGLAAVLAVAWLLAGRSSETPGTGTDAADAAGAAHDSYRPPSEDGYVGSAACAACHEEIAESYKSHPMSRSIVPVTADPDMPDVSREETRLGEGPRHYDVEVRDGRMLHHELMLDASGEPIYDLPVSMDYVVGSGRRAKAYIFQRGDRLCMSPLNWYSGPRAWDFAPGHDADDPRRFDRRATDACLSCHAGRVAAEGRLLNTFGRPPFREAAIGCENCHGPGERHVALHSGRLPEGTADTIVDPARLEPARREAVCWQCHLQTESRIARPGRSDFDFRPGMRLDDVWVHVDAGGAVDGSGRTRAVSHVQQMRDSRCYAGSGGRFGCVSCHDPHRVPAESERVDFYRGKCLNCHADDSCSAPVERRSALGDSCFECHMPARAANNVSHVTQTDHRVIRSAGASADAGVPGEGAALALFGDEDLRVERWERDRALGLAAWERLSKGPRRPPAELSQFLSAVLKRAPQDGAVLTALGSLENAHGRGSPARDYLERALSDPAAEEMALDTLLEIYYRSSDRERALACADRLLEIDPGSARVHALRADLLALLGRPEEGVSAARRALELNPGLVPVRRWLANLYRSSGHDGLMREQERIIERLEGAVTRGSSPDRRDAESR